MGIQKEPAAFVAQLPLPKGFSVCELGDQGMCGEPTKRLARVWYEQELGCGRYVSIDGNGRGTFVADLNLPIDVHSFELVTDCRMKAFDLVTDFGTGEHIFDQAQVWRTLHDLTKPGGYIAFDRPSQGYGKHCYYITNECLYRDIAAANDYAVLWLERALTPRGELIRGVFQRPTTAVPFKVPQQGRYQSSLVIPL
jgi:SAM-dependent methyltransferase